MNAHPFDEALPGLVREAAVPAQEQEEGDVDADRVGVWARVNVAAWLLSTPSALTTVT